MKNAAGGPLLNNRRVDRGADVAGERIDKAGHNLLHDDDGEALRGLNDEERARGAAPGELAH